MEPLSRLRGLCAVLLLFVLSGCATTASISDGAELREGQGLLAMRVSSNVDSMLTYVNYNANPNFGTFFVEELVGPKGAISFKQGEAYWVVPMGQGEYMWGRFISGNRYTILHGSNRFEIKANTITYIGHLYIDVQGNRMGLRGRDEEADIRAYLEQSYPAYLDSMAIEKNLLDLR